MAHYPHVTPTSARSLNEHAAARSLPAAQRTALVTVLRRVVVGYRVVGASWLTLLGGVALAQGAPVTPAAATVALALAWTAATVLVARRRPGWLGSPGWLAADVAVAAATILVPSVAARTMTAFFGGYPFSSLALAATMAGWPAALAAGAVLAAATVGRLALVPDGMSVQVVVETVVFYLVSATILAWANGVLRRSDAQRRAAEEALAAERAERVLAQERAETAAHLHDSVLQTLALIQRRSDDAGAVTALARRQERELRDWLAGARRTPAEPRTGFADALTRAAAEVEADHHVTVELVTVGDAALDAGLDALVAATREAVTNAAKHAGEDSLSVYAEVAADAVRVFVRDRGAGFDPATVPGDRRGISESIVGRMARHGGSAQVRSSPGEGTEVELTLPA